MNTTLPNLFRVNQTVYTDSEVDLLLLTVGVYWKSLVGASLLICVVFILGWLFLYSQNYYFYKKTIEDQAALRWYVDNRFLLHDKYLISSDLPSVLPLPPKDDSSVFPLQEPTSPNSV